MSEISVLSTLVGAAGVGRHFKRSRHWGWTLLKAWHEEQKADGLPRVVKKGRALYTTAAVLCHYAPKRDETLARRVRELETDVLRAFARIAELERRLGARR